MRLERRLDEILANKDLVMIQLDEVEDPELDISIVELGLVYESKKG